MNLKPVAFGERGRQLTGESMFKATRAALLIICCNIFLCNIFAPMA